MDVHDVSLSDKTKVDITSLGNIELVSLIEAEDFSLNILFNGKFALKMQLEQWEGFVKEVMALWSRRPKNDR